MHYLYSSPGLAIRVRPSITLSVCAHLKPASVPVFCLRWVIQEMNSHSTRIFVSHFCFCVLRALMFERRAANNSLRCSLSCARAARGFNLDQTLTRTFDICIRTRIVVSSKSEIAHVYAGRKWTFSLCMQLLCEESTLEFQFGGLPHSRAHFPNGSQGYHSHT